MIHIKILHKKTCDLQSLIAVSLKIVNDLKKGRKHATVGATKQASKEKHRVGRQEIISIH